MALVVNQGTGADGVNDRHGGRLDGFGLLGDVNRRVANVQHAFLEESGGMGVAIDGPRGQAIVMGDSGSAVPVEEIEFDFDALLVFADGAFAGVAAERRRIAAGAGCGAFAASDRTMSVAADCEFFGHGSLCGGHF